MTSSLGESGSNSTKACERDQGGAEGVNFLGRTWLGGGGQGWASEDLRDSRCLWCASLVVSC